MATSLQEMVAQKEALEQKIAEATAHGRSEAVAQVKAMMAEHGLTMADLGSTRKSAGQSKAPAKKVAAKYRSTSTGESWSGRGLQPRWLKAALASGKKLSDFAV